MANENLITPAPVTTPIDPAAIAAAPTIPQTTPAPAAVPVANEVPTAPATVLGEALDKKPTDAPVEAPKVETPVVEQKAAPAAESVKTDQPKTTESKSDEPAPLPVYDQFKVPEGVTLDKEQVGKFTGLLADLEGKGKVDHALVQEFGQKAVDFHVAEIKRATEAVTELYRKSWEKQKIDWKDSFLKDPDMGGNRFQTTVDSALNFIRTHGGTPEQQTEFRNLMETSGLGNHPAMIRILANAGRAMSEGKPLASVKPVPAPKSKVNTLYGNMGQ